MRRGDDGLNPVLECQAALIQSFLDGSGAVIDPGQAMVMNVDQGDDKS